MKTQTSLDELALAVANEFLSRRSSDGHDSTDQLIESIELEFRSTLREKLSELITIEDPDATIDPSADFGTNKIDATPMPMLDATIDSEAGIKVDTKNDGLMQTIDSEAGIQSVQAPASPVSEYDEDGLMHTMDSESPPISEYENITLDGADASVDSKAPTVRRGGTGVVSKSADAATIDPTSKDSSKDADFTIQTKGKAKKFAPPAGYELIDVLGKGGMGIVFKAKHIPLDRVVAVKMILAGANASEAQVDRFQREAEAAAHLTHPNIVSVYEVGEHDGLPYFSLEFVEGQAMNELMKETTMTPRDAAKILLPIARALEYSHTQGVLHRDIKPQNILISKDGVPKVADFGLAKRLDSDQEQTVEGVLIGTPGYLAPEQASDTRKVGPHSDVFALGCVLYCCITGRPPFIGPTAIDSVRQLMFKEAVMPSKLLSGVDPDLETICLKAIEKEIPKRYATAGEFADELERFINGEPIVARPITRTERFWKWCKRNPKVAALSGLAASLLMVLLFGGIISAIVINERKKAEVLAKEDAQVKAIRAEAQAQVAAKTSRMVIYETKEFFKENPKLLPLREKVLNEIITRAEEVYADDIRKDGIDVNKIYRTASTRQLGTVYLDAEKYDKAIEKLEEARKSTNELRKEGRLKFGDISEMKILLALGDAYKGNRDYETARDTFTSLLKTREEYFAKAANVDEAAKLDSLATVHGRLATTYLLLDKPDLAKDHSLKAVEGRKAAYEKSPKSYEATQEYAAALSTLSTVYERLGETDKMFETSRESLELRTQLATTRNDLASLHNLAVGHKTLARQHLQLRQYEIAASLLESANEIWDELLALNPENIKVPEQAADTSYFLGLARTWHGESPGDSFDRAEKLQNQVIKRRDNLSTKGMLLKIVSAAGNAEKSNAMIEEILSSGDSAFHKGISACGYSLLLNSLSGEDRQATTNKAIELTREMIRKGYDDFKGLRQTEIEFMPLHSSKEYQAMLDEEEAKLKEKAG